jgi:hypothetical protein
MFACSLGVTPACATTFALGEAQATFSGAVSAGTAIRTRGPDSTLFGPANGAASGMGAGTSPAGRNQDDGNLNYRRGDPVSTVLKALVNFEVKHGSWGAHVRAMAWRDFTLTDGKVPWGNLPNNTTPGRLGESSDSPYGRYSGAALLDANVYGTTEVNGRPLFGKLGNQLIPWGVPTTIAGGLGALNPVNSPASRRPGVLPEEVYIPFPAVFARLGLTSTTNVEAFYQLMFQRSEPFGCGTFFSSLDYYADRCDKVVFGAGLTDRESIAQGNYAKRASDRYPSDQGQFGIGITHTVEPIATQFGAYFAQYHARGGIVGVVKSLRATGEPFIVGDPGGLNPQYLIQYPEGIRMFGVNMVTRRPDFTLYAEIVHRLNQPLSLTGTDLTNVSTSSTAPSLVRAEYAAVPLGGFYEAYDRFATADMIVGGSRTFGGVLGAKSATLGGEAGLKYVHALPDPNVRRYGRSDVFGSVPFNGTCTTVAPGLTCSNDGFVTPFAYGVRARGSLSYPDVFPNVDVTPSVFYGYDIRGWSYDGVFSEGRNLAAISLRAEYKRRYTAEVAYLPTWGGRYNNLRDRDVMTMAVGAKF